MSATDQDEPPAIATTAPSPLEKRDLLGNFCFYLHFAVMITIVAGWAVPWHPFLVFYLVLLPLMVLTWQLNKNSCVLNNIESFMRYGTWRAEQNAEEGAWLLTLIKNVTGVTLAVWQVDAITYSILAMLWLAGLSHIYRWW
jgi:hypothetical protein